jgi:hypothetical protein
MITPSVVSRASHHARIGGRPVVGDLNDLLGMGLLRSGTTIPGSGAWGKSLSV